VWLTCTVHLDGKQTSLCLRSLLQTSTTMGVRPVQIGMLRPFRGSAAVSIYFEKESWNSRCSSPACVQEHKEGSTAKNAIAEKFLYVPANSD
jgi:hypothetical protein